MCISALICLGSQQQCLLLFRDLYFTLKPVQSFYLPKREQALATDHIFLLFLRWRTLVRIESKTKLQKWPDNMKDRQTGNGSRKWEATLIDLCINRYTEARYATRILS